jgi:hypothetical protein
LKIQRVLTGKGLNEVQRIMKYDPSLRSFNVDHAATYTRSEECVTLLSIQRGNEADCVWSASQEALAK